MKSRLGLKVLGLCALVVGMMAIGTTGAAQAEPTAKWGYINPTTKVLEFFSKTLEAAPVLEIEKESALLVIEGLTITVLCKTAEFDEGGQLSAEGSILLGRIKFGGCKSFIKGVESKVCEPNDPVSGKGTVLTEKGTGLIKLHEGDSTVLLKPDVENGPLAKIHLGELCGAGEEIILTGELVIWDCEGNTSFKTHKVKHLIAEYTKLQLMKNGIHKAFIEGSALVSLGGVHKGYEWAGLPG